MTGLPPPRIRRPFLWAASIASTASQAAPSPPRIIAVAMASSRTDTDSGRNIRRSQSYLPHAHDQRKPHRNHVLDRLHFLDRKGPRGSSKGAAGPARDRNPTSGGGPG